MNVHFPEGCICGNKILTLYSPHPTTGGSAEICCTVCYRTSGLSFNVQIAISNFKAKSYIGYKGGLIT